jgi:hypothetical protein
MPLPTNGRAARQGVWPRRPLRRVTSHKYGTRALALLLTIYQDRYGLRSIRQRINRWAPPVENVTSAYVSHVAALTGRDPDVNLDFTATRISARWTKPSSPTSSAASLQRRRHR